MPNFVRVTDDVKPRREYTVPEGAVTDAHKVLADKAATYPDGRPLPAKHAPDSLSSKSGPKAETTTNKEK